jgi:hypothetical protein
MAAKPKARKKSVARGKAKKAKRTVLYSRSGKKLYAKRSKSGKFTDIQSYQRAHSADLKRTSKAERASRASKAKTSAKPAAVSKAGTKTKARAAAAPKKVARKKVKPVAAASAGSPRTRHNRAARLVRQIPRSQQSYAMTPKPAADAVIELAVPELAVPTSVQGEVPAGGE